MRTLLIPLMFVVCPGSLIDAACFGFYQEGATKPTQSAAVAGKPSDKASELAQTGASNEPNATDSLSANLRAELQGIVPVHHLPIALSENNRKIYTALEQEVTFGHGNLRLNDFVQGIGKTYEVPVFLNVLELELIGVDPATQLKLDIPKSKLRNLLTLVLQELDLTFIVRNEVLEITSLDSAESNPVNDVYRLPPSLSGEVAEQLAEMLIRMVDPDSWTENGGTNELMIVADRLLVISAPTTTHYKVQELLGKVINKHFEQE